MSVINDERIAQLSALSVEEKTTLARANYETVLKAAETKGDEAKEKIRESIYILASAIIFGNYAFSETERVFLEATIELKKEKALELKHECEEYFYDAIDVLKSTLGEEDIEKLLEIMVLIATVDEHASKKEKKWLRKLINNI